jgi:hypothetical protein
VTGNAEFQRIGVLHRCVEATPEYHTNEHEE